MHRSTRLTWSPITLIVLVAPMVGCRNTNPDGSISVQPQFSSLAERLQGPKSRLGTSGRSAADRLESESPEDSDSQGRPQLASKDRSSGSQQKGKSDPKEAFTAEELEVLEEAFANATPEIRELAIRRLAAQRAQENNATGSESAEEVSEMGGDETLLQQAGGNVERRESGVIPTSATSTESQSKPATSLATVKPDQFEMPDLTGSSSKSPAPAVAASTTTTSPTPQPGDSGEPVAIEETASTLSPTPKSNASTPPTKVASDIGAPDTAATDGVTVPPQPAATVAGAEAVAANPASDSSANPPPHSLANELAPTNEPAERETSTTSLASVSDAQLVEELLARHSKRLSEATDPSLSDVLRVRTLQVLAGRPEDAVAEIQGWGAAEREYVNQQMLTLWHLTDPSGHPVRSRRWSTALPFLREASQSLAAATGKLDVRALQFCQEVVGFGQTVPFDSREFFPGQNVILYCEVDNFDAERLTDGYETHLRASYQILDAKGQLVAEQILEDDRQACNNYRRDYFLGYILHLPERLTPGNYRFELTVEDVKGHTYGQATMPLNVKTL